MSLDEVKSLILSLSPDEQLHLLDQLSEELQGTMANRELTAEQRAELERRIAEADAHPESLIPLDEVERRLSKFK